MTALAGLRVLVPRDGRWGDDAAAAVRAAGAEPVIVPLLAFAPVTGEQRSALLAGVRALAAGEFDWLVVTSPRTVTALVEVLEEAGLGAGASLDAVAAGERCAGSEARMGLADAVPARTRVAAVGAATALALARHGVSADFVPEGEASARGMVAEWPGDPGRVLWPHSALARPTITDGLEALGGVVAAPVAYVPTTPEVPAEVAASLRAGEVPVALVTSGSIACALHEVAGEAVSVVSIGPITTEDARAVGLRVVAEAAEPSVPAMLAALAAAWPASE